MLLNVKEPKPLNMKEILFLTKKKGASDLHLYCNMPPVFRIKGELCQMSCEPLSNEDIVLLLNDVMTKRHKEVLERKKSVDFAISSVTAGRFRFAVYYQQGVLSVAARLLSDKIADLKSLGLPESVAKFAEFRDGLVLVTGVTGSGKSTTLATIIDLINKNYKKNIITVEDPVEYLHENHNSIIHQREVHSDVLSFADALRDSLRADPDVILVGEIRDLETMRTAVMAAETGHLVFATLHSKDALSSVNRMVGAFPAAEQPQLRQQLASTLRGVLSQRLIPDINNTKRVPAAELMFVNQAISNLIRQAKDDMIYSAIETGLKENMQTMEQSLIKLLEAGEISRETAISSAKNRIMMEKRLERACFCPKQDECVFRSVCRKNPKSSNSFNLKGVSNA
ncbi:MAG: PilT/PilU family type 4a pilus ATPase [Desulforegulaceae bacterium]|nr:PilT/PilU family type 4a pilus ATPase [Desulforegulaceae bacterium]